MQTKPNKTLMTNLLRQIMTLMLLVGMFGFTRTGTVYALNSTIYVKAGASGANNGSSWANAYTSLQDALSAAVSSDQIWVAAGTYDPTTGADRSATFMLKKGVSIYGGFDGTEALLAERDPATNVTILSGDIGTPDNTGDNSYHVVTGGGTGSSAVLDGFTIMAGNANGIINPDYYGGGIYNTGGSPTLSNLIVSGNTASFYGGGMYNNISSPSITNVTFSGNSATRGAGMYNNNGSNLTLTNVTFSGNVASYRGGGMTVASSSPSLTNVTFSGNIAPRGGGLHNAYDGNPTLTNVTFSGNSASIAGGAIYNIDSNPIIINSILYGNPGGEIFNEVISEGESVPVSTPVVSYSIVQGGYPGTGNLNANPVLGALANNGGFTLTMALGGGSPAIDAGYDPNCPATDQRGMTRPVGGHCDIGAYEYESNNGGDTVGVFRPGNGLLYLKNQNTSGFADVAINYGLGGDYPVVGDWDGNGTATIGVYRNGRFLLRNSNTLGFADLNFAFGQVGDQPIAGDWNGNGIDTIGVYRPSTGLFLLRNSNDAGSADMSFYLGNVGDVGIAGDWNADGIDTTGVFRPSNGILFLKNTNATGFADIALNYGLPGDQPVVGDWDNNGTVTIGIYRNARFYLRNSNTNGFADILLDLGNPGDMPIAGNWDGIP